MTEHDDPTLKVAIDLHEIIRLNGELHQLAYDLADDEDMPGGAAMVALAPVAHLTAWAEKLEAAEHRWLAGKGPEPFSDDSDEWEPPLQLLEFWSEVWRMDLDKELPDRDPNTGRVIRATIKSEATFLGNCITWAYEHEPRFDLYARDVSKARRILENMLHEGERRTPGIQCPDCRRRALVRTELDRRRKKHDCPGHGPLRICPTAGCDGAHDRGGLVDEWTCPNPECRAVFDKAHYDEAVFKDYVRNAPYLELKYVPKRVDDVKPGTVKVWASRNQVRTRRNARDEQTYCIEDIEARLTQPDEVA